MEQVFGRKYLMASRKKKAGRISGILDFVDDVSCGADGFYIIDFLGNNVVYGKKSFHMMCLKFCYAFI